MVTEPTFLARSSADWPYTPRKSTTVESLLLNVTLRFHSGWPCAFTSDAYTPIESPMATFWVDGVMLTPATGPLGWPPPVVSGGTTVVSGGGGGGLFGRFRFNVVVWPRVTATLVTVALPWPIGAL